MNSMQYIEVAPLKIVRHGQDSFTYLSNETLSIGQLVKVPTGRFYQVGLVIRAIKKPAYNVKPVQEVLPYTPLPTPLVRTAVWMADYYHTPLATVLQSILPTGLTTKRRPRENNKPLEVLPEERTNFVFNKSQVTAIQTISNIDHGTLLLHGITGSGKTAVYIEASKQALAANTSVIALVPEIALTSQLVNDLSAHFGDRIVLTHSKQTEAERHLVWQSVLASSEPHVIIGPRSSLFMPLRKIGLIVIDECHEPSYKQDHSPRYSALRVASVLAAEHTAKVIFGSATPSVTDYYLALKTKRHIVELPIAARTDTIKPAIKIVDMTKRQNFTNHRFFSDALLTRIKNQQPGEQTLIFHNRRGSASITLCDNCSWQAGCSRCFIPLTLHADRHLLLCHICGTSAKVPTTCPQCGSTNIFHKGIGTKLIESEIKRLFPHLTVGRFDGDSKHTETLEKRYRDVHNGSIDIIVGTQILAKGLNLPHLRTVGIIQADAGLSLPDFAAAERTFQLLSQVIGRVGRSHHPTVVVVQSYQPTHPIVTDGISQNYTDFYARTLEQRKRSNFPPFCYLLKLSCIYKTETTAIQNAQKLARLLKQECPDIEVLGPTPAFYERQANTYRWQLILKSPKRQRLLEVLDYLPPQHWQYDIDPHSLL